MSSYARESSEDSDWVHVTPPGEPSLQFDSTRYFIDVGDESSVDLQSFGGTQNPRPPTNPRPRPPRQSLTYVADDSWRSTTPVSTARYYPRDPSNDADVLFDGASAIQLGPDTRRDPLHGRIDRWPPNDDPDFYHGAIVPQHRYEDQDRPWYQPSSPSVDTPSLAMTAGSRTTYYDPFSSSRPPSLISARSDRRASGPSAQTAPILSMPRPYFPEEDDAWSPFVLEDHSPARGNLQCPLAFLGCRQWFDDPRQWETHHQAHFRGRLPQSIHCPFTGCGERFRAEPGREAWGARWNHIVHCPFRTSEVSVRPTRSLIDHLWRIGVINAAEVQQLRQTGSLGGPGHYLESSSHPRDRRPERRLGNYGSSGGRDYGGGTNFPSRR